MNNMNIKDVNGNFHQIDLNSINDDMVNTAKFGANGRVFTIGGNDFHLTDIVKSLHNECKNNFTTHNTPLLFNAIKICSKAEEAGYRGADYSNMSPLKKMVADAKHWFSQKTRESYFQELLNKVSKNISDPTFKKSKGYEEFCKSHYDLGKCYLDGIGTKKNEKKGIKHLYIAAGFNADNVRGNINEANIDAQKLVLEKKYLKNPLRKAEIEHAINSRQNPEIKTNPSKIESEESSDEGLVSGGSSGDEGIFGFAPKKTIPFTVSSEDEGTSSKESSEDESSFGVTKKKRI